MDAETLEGLHEHIMEEAKNGYIVFYDGESLMRAKLDDFVKQGSSGVLYDLNRLEEVTITLAKNNVQVSMTERMVNDIAMATLVRYLMGKLNLEK